MGFEPWMLLILPLFFGVGWLAARMDIRVLLFESSGGSYIQNELKELKEEVKAAITNSKPSWDILQDVAVACGATQPQLYSALLALQREIVTGRDKELQPHMDLITGYIEHHRRSEPYAQVPPRIRLYIERLAEVLVAPHDDLLNSLVAEITDLAQINERTAIAQRFYTQRSYVFGLVGIGIGLVGLVFPEFPRAISTAFLHLFAR